MLVLDNAEYKDKANLIKKLEAAYGNEHIFKHAMLMLLEEHERDATAFGLYFGYHKEPMTLKSISEQMNISTSRVRTLSDRAFRHLIAPGFRKRVWEDCGYKELPKP
jgi:DNA-directed RNA polymerase sigma subunit (sigma70/sigma32)